MKEYGGFDIIPAASFSSTGLQIYAPSLKLSAWVQCVWATVGGQETPRIQEDKFYPDAGASLTFDISNGNVDVLLLHQTQVVRQCWDLNRDFVSVRFRPGAVKALLGVAVESGKNLQLPLLNEPALPACDLHPLCDVLPELSQVRRVRAIFAWLEGLVERRQNDQNQILGIVTLAAQKLLLPNHLADAVGLSRRTLERRFKNLLGFTPLQVHSYGQIRRARQHLMSGEFSLADIALDCGYYDQAHFSNVFRKQTGETPQQYRQRKLSHISNH
ncbi:helix-turn-helix domain-containing protein [Planctobacterium marinum]|uniref:helix-turn-helix domain-containing protein n=1 Tax=Planctobacterium marinum TaxID=1631968 RepID=UPI001E41C002|nr:AraC family transcriptional regulator [Planctobacterium marinum]MCC2605903.1 AraC family transcriptional regulator [Planctobacterium marinum]